jgi:cell division protein FtsN
MLKSAPRLRPVPTARQRGNTLVGIIIGLVIGLGIAVIVALAITKGASPFTDRGSKAGKPIDPAAGATTDPNQPMYGNKEAARDAAGKQARDAAAAAANPATPAAPASATPPAPARVAPAPDALQELVDKLKGDGAPVIEKSRPAATATSPAAAAAAAAAGDDKFVYYLQVGAFRQVTDAESARAKLALLGFEAAISDRSTDNGVLHRVRVGPYNQVEAMNRARGKLSENGVDVAVVRNQK